MRFILLIPILIVAAACHKSSKALTSSEWFDNEVGSFGWTASFKDGKYTVHFSGEGCGGHDGTYTVDGDKVVLKAPHEEVCAPGNLTRGGQITCTLGKTSQSLFRQVYLDCGKDLRFWALEPKAEANVSREYKGQMIFTLGLTKGKITEEAMFRRQPNRTAPGITCNLSVDSDGLNQKEKRSLPKDQAVLVLARTTETVAVDKWDNYWYLIRPVLGWNESCGEPDIGWVFGEFIQVE